MACITTLFSTICGAFRSRPSLQIENFGRPAVPTEVRDLIRRRKAPSTNWRAFLKNHVTDIVAIDFFVVQTVGSRVLFVFLILAHCRRRVLHFNVTTNPTSAWTAQQMAEAFPWEETPRYLLRDRDAIYSHCCQRRVRKPGTKHVVIAARSPSQHP